MKDGLKILKVEYLRNHLLDHYKMTKPYFVNPSNEDDLKKWNISATTVWIVLYEFLWGN